MKKKHFALIIICIAIFTFWPQYKSPGQSGNHPAAATLDAKEKTLEKKINEGKEAVYDEINRIKNLPPKTVIKHSVRTIYRDVAHIIYIDTCIGRIAQDTFLNLNVYDTTHAPVQQKKLNFFQSLFRKIFHPKKQPS